MSFKRKASSTQPAAFIGTAGWSLPRAEHAHFAAEGSHLERYASRFQAAEINSSFYKPHKPETYERWSASVPAGFRFSVKIPKEVTHTLRLAGAAEQMTAFLAQVSGLGEKLGCLLVQLPPSLTFDAPVAGAFFRMLRERTAVPLACEPRHASWFGEEADTLLRDHEVARVAADPARVPEAAVPGGSRTISYYRLHGSPKMYYSDYTAEFLTVVADNIREDLAHQRTAWCIFDNTTLGAATKNARELESALARHDLKVTSRRSSVAVSNK